MFREEIERINHVSEKLTELRGVSLTFPPSRNGSVSWKRKLPILSSGIRGDRAQELLKERTQRSAKSWWMAGLRHRKPLKILKCWSSWALKARMKRPAMKCANVLPDLERQVDKMEFARMLSGEHDASKRDFEYQRRCRWHRGPRTGPTCCCACICVFVISRGLKPRLPIISPAMMPG